MASNETSICNLALGKLGAKTIMSLDDASPEARACKLHYDSTRDEVLRSHRWNFAIRRARLARLTEDPIFGWSSQYTLPADCLRVLQVNGYEETTREGRWEVEGRRLLSSSTCANMKYISRVTDCNLFDALFVKALVLKLAADLAKPLTGSSSLSGDLLTEYTRMTGPQARSADAFEGRPKRKLPWVGSDFVRSRLSSFFFDGGDDDCGCGEGVDEEAEGDETPAPSQYFLVLSGISIEYGPAAPLSGTLHDEVLGELVDGVVIFPATELPGGWVMGESSYDPATGKFIAFSLVLQDAVGWRYPDTDGIGCPKLEGQYPTLGAQTLAMNPDQVEPDSFWYDEISTYDTNPGLPMCDSGSNTSRISAGTISVEVR